MKGGCPQRETAFFVGRFRSGVSHSGVSFMKGIGTDRRRACYTSTLAVSALIN